MCACGKGRGLTIKGEPHNRVYMYRRCPLHRLGCSAGLLHTDQAAFTILFFSVASEITILRLWVVILIHSYYIL